MRCFELLSNVILPAAVFLWLQIPLIGKGQNIKIESKVSAYGQSLTLICEIENCCNKSVAWEIWEPEFRTIFVDVRNVTFNETAKYSSGARRNGYSLIIRNLSRYDINKFYSCTYGFKQSDKFILLEDAVFITETSTVFIDDANSTGGNDTWWIVAIIFLVVFATACVAAAVWFIVQRRKNNRDCQQDEPDDAYRSQTNTSIADHEEREHLLNAKSCEMPAGDLATGLAWSHFLGYLSIILPELGAKIKECEWYKKHPGKMITQFLILLPKSGVCNPLQDKDRRITNVGHLKVEAQVAGTKRQYTPNVYCIKDERKQTSYYCCAEIPSAFGCIGKIFFQKRKKLSLEQRNLEVDRFYNILGQILSHSEQYQMLYKLIPYNDEKGCEEGRPSTQILRYFEETQTSVTDDEMSHNNVNDGVCLLYGEVDESHANNVTGGLSTMHYTSRVTKVCPDQEDRNEVIKAIKESRWVVLILSTNQKWFEDWLSDVLYSAIGVSVLPILFNVKPEAVPTFLKYSKYIEAKDGDYLTQIYEIIQGQSVSLEKCCVGKTVHEGLVWAFVVNYLNHVLPGITQRIEQRLEELSENRCDPHTHYHRGLLEIVPMNCEVPDKLDGEWENCKIENKGRIGPTEEQQQQKIVRVFACNFYKLTKGDHSYYFAGEFVTPIRTLKGMRDSEVCGLTNDQMLEETKLFTKELDKIMKTENEGRHCAILRLQDNQSIPDLVIEAIQEDENTRHTNS